MVRTGILIAYGAFSLVILIGAGMYGANIPFVQQWPLFEALRNTASIIFAVVGAWLAIIYPERLKLTFRADAKVKSPGPNMDMLLTPAVHSTILLVVLLLIGLVAPLAKQLTIVQHHVEICRATSFVVLSALTLWQVAIVVITLFPAEAVHVQASIEAAEQGIFHQYTKSRQTLGNRELPSHEDDN